jgi:uncharacterized protein YeaO (DUF488 family)
MSSESLEKDEKSSCEAKKEKVNYTQKKYKTFIKLKDRNDPSNLEFWYDKIRKDTLELKKGNNILQAMDDELKDKTYHIPYLLRMKTSHKKNKKKSAGNMKGSLENIFNSYKSLPTPIVPTTKGWPYDKKKHKDDLLSLIDEYKKSDTHKKISEMRKQNQEKNIEIGEFHKKLSAEMNERKKKLSEMRNRRQEKLLEMKNRRQENIHI